MGPGWYSPRSRIDGMPSSALQPVSVNVAGASITLLTRPGTLDGDIVNEVLDTYQIQALVERLRSKRSVIIFDIGAHIGVFSVAMATLLPRAIVHAFEPAPDNFEMLEQNIRH